MVRGSWSHHWSAHSPMSSLAFLPMKSSGNMPMIQPTTTPKARPKLPATLQLRRQTLNRPLELVPSHQVISSWSEDRSGGWAPSLSAHDSTYQALPIPSMSERVLPRAAAAWQGEDCRQEVRWPLGQNWRKIYFFISQSFTTIWTEASALQSRHVWMVECNLNYKYYIFRVHNSNWSFILDKLINIIFFKM